MVEINKLKVPTWSVIALLFALDSMPVNAEVISAGAGTELSVGFEGTDINNDSILLKVTMGGVKFLFTGDAEKEANNAYVLDPNDAYNVDIDVLKVSHHGRTDANSVSLFQELTPTVGFISTHNDGLLQHPAVWDLLAQQTDVFRTDLPSPNANRADPDTTSSTRDLVIRTDGVSIIVEYRP